MIFTALIIANGSGVEHLLRKALNVIPKERLWVNPDCGLKRVAGQKPSTN